MQGNLLIIYIYIYIYLCMYKPIHCSLHDFCLLKIHVSLSFLHPETLVISGESGGCAGTMATLVALELAARAGAGDGLVALPWLDK